MNAVGLFEAKTKLSELCARVAETGTPLVVTRRGKPLVRIEPIVEGGPMTLRERRASYSVRYGALEERDADDFAPPSRRDEPRDIPLD